MILPQKNAKVSGKTMMRNQTVLAIVILSMVLWVSSLNAASFHGLGNLPEGDFVSTEHGISADGRRPRQEPCD